MRRDNPMRRAALPRRLRRPRLLVVGCGDVGLRLVAALGRRLPDALHICAVTRNAGQRMRAEEHGARALAIDLDDRRDLRRLASLARWVIHLAPPRSDTEGDPRTAHLIAACRPAIERARRCGIAPARWIYVSTTGVYGDAGGAFFDETRRLAPSTARARRRVAAESGIRSLARGGARAAILRAPGIYAHDRLPVERLRRGDPVPDAHDDVYTNHIHADDLARIAWLALFRARPARVYHAVDDRPMRVGDYLDRVADAIGLARPPRVARAALAAHLGPQALSFLGESRRLDNRRLKTELRYRLRWPSVETTLADLSRTRRNGAL